MNSEKESREMMKALYPREQALARKILGIDWYDVEGQARQVICQILADQSLALHKERQMLATRIEQYVSKAHFANNCDKQSILECLGLLAADTPFVIENEQVAFDAWIKKEAGDEAAKRWPNENGPMYERARVQDYRTGWVECLRWMKNQPIEPGSELIKKWLNDSYLLDAMEMNCWDVRFNSSPNGDAGDSSIGIEVVGHFMQKPHQRILGENYNENLRAALEQATKADANPPARPEYDNEEDE